MSNGNVLVSFSHLKLFSKCPRLYKEQYIDKTYTPPQQDYFIYGSLVDAMLTDADNVDSRFIKVDRKVDPKKILQIEEDIKGIKDEMDAPDSKGVSMRQKAINGNKTAIKGIELRELKLSEKLADLISVRSMGSKTQVTQAIWNDCEETAECIRNNPLYKQVLKADPIFQVTLQSSSLGRKGTLDLLVLSAPLRSLFLSWNMDMARYGDFRASVDALPVQDKWAIVIDIKTCAALAYDEFDPRMYAGQLEVYRSLVSDVIGVNPACAIIAGDKDATRKMSQDYLFSDDVLHRAAEQVSSVESIYRLAIRDNFFPPAKQIYGKKQKCFSCSMCSNRPYSIDDSFIVNMQ